MGLISKVREFKEKRHQSRIEKAYKQVKNAKAIKEDRMSAIEYLAAHEEVDTCCHGLLPRFEYSLEQSILDTREKEKAMGGIVSHGEKALPLIEHWIQTTSKIAWPIKILREIGDENQVIDVLKKALDFGDVAFNQQAVDKNYDVLCYLREFQLGEYTEKLFHFLADADERVRFSCAEVLIEQDNAVVSDKLEKYLSDESSENTRIRQAVFDAFAEKEWTLNDAKKLQDIQIPHGFKVDYSQKIVTLNR